MRDVGENVFHPHGDSFVRCVCVCDAKLQSMVTVIIKLVRVREATLEPCIELCQCVLNSWHYEAQKIP